MQSEMLRKPPNVPLKLHYDTTKQSRPAARIAAQGPVVPKSRKEDHKNGTARPSKMCGPESTASLLQHQRPCPAIAHLPHHQHHHHRHPRSSFCLRRYTGQLFISEELHLCLNPSLIYSISPSEVICTSYPS